MKKITKILALLLTLTIAVGMFTACGDNAVNDGKVTLKVGDCPSKGEAVARVQAKIERFEKDNPDVKIEPDTWTFDLSTFYPKAEAGMLPDVFISYFTEIKTIVDAGYAADITDALKKYGLYDKLSPAILNLVTRDGRVYGYPTSSYALGLACNTEMFEAAGLMQEDGTPMQPKDWYELRDFAVKVKNATGKPGFVFPTSGNYGGWFFTNLAWTFGTEFMKQDSNGKWIATFNTPETVEALQYIKDLKWEYDVLPSNTLIDATEYFKTFAVGNASMQITASFTGNYEKYDMPIDSIGALALPAGPAGQISLMGGGIQFVTAGADEATIDAAVRWIKNSTDFEATDSLKQSVNDSLKSRAESGHLIGINQLSVWNSNAPAQAYRMEQESLKANVNPNHLKLYNEYITNPDIKLQPEEPTRAQELYGLLDTCIQTVLTDKNADCAAILEKANTDFQTNYLDKIID